jgi:casein kinase 1
MPDEDDPHPPILPYEYQVYCALGRQNWLPITYWMGQDGGAHVMVLQRLGANLEQIHRVCRGRFSLKTVLMLADKMVRFVW